jgi:serine/threonine protein kinase
MASSGDEPMRKSAGGSTLRPETLTPEIQDNEIELIEELGSGCFGKVYLGKCRGKDVAIKKLHSQRLDEKTLRDFKKEVEVMTQLHHPNVVLFMGACFEEGKLAMVSEVMQGSLDKLLHNPKVEISLAKRIKFAKDTALGMQWLHSSQPQIIHRDLKPGNLLYDEHWNVKVCDFGLAAVKERGQKIQDQGSIPGTPIWMAPEVMMGRQLDEKSDVYSYGIVLWEILTGQEPFLEYKSFRVFKRAICLENIRPPIPDWVPAPLSNLMKSCWQKDPGGRPGFDEIARLLDSAAVEDIVLDAEGQNFWKEHFFGKTTVPWSKFEQEFCAYFDKSPQEWQLETKCLKELCAIEGSKMTADPWILDLEMFANLLNWFGPMSKADPRPIPVRVASLMKKKFFHGHASKEDSEKKLDGQPKGTWLLRTRPCSHLDKDNPFAISKVSRHGNINHQRVAYNPHTTTFSLNILYKQDQMNKVESKPFENVEIFLAGLEADLYLKHECPGSPYSFLFEAPKSKIEGYLVDPSPI